MLLFRMFLRSINRRKDGKDHRYFSVVENRRVPGGKSVQRTVLLRHSRETTRLCSPKVTHRSARHVGPGRGFGTRATWLLPHLSHQPKLTAANTRLGRLRRDDVGALHFVPRGRPVFSVGNSI